MYNSLLGLLFYTIIVIAFTCFIFNRIKTDKQVDKVNHPPHYQKNGKECIEVMEEQFGPKAVYWFCFLNAFKYKWRAGFKDGNSYKQDLAKAKWYTDYAMKLYRKYPGTFINPGHN